MLDADASNKPAYKFVLNVETYCYGECRRRRHMLQALRKLTGRPEHKLEPVTHHHLLFGSCHRCRCLDRGRRNLQRRQRNYRLQRLSRIRSRRRSRMRRNLRPPPLGRIRCPRRRISLFERDKPPTVELNEVQSAAAAAAAEPNQMSPAPAITVEPCKGPAELPAAAVEHDETPQRTAVLRGPDIPD